MIAKAGEAPLSVITGGRHTHMVRAPNHDALEAAKRELDERGHPGRGLRRHQQSAGGTLPLMDANDERTTDSGIECAPSTLPMTSSDSIPRAARRAGRAAVHARLYPTMYRGRLWTMRQYAGMATAAETNPRFRYLLEHGQTGLSCRVRPAHADGLRRGPSARRGRGGQDGRRDRLGRGHAAAVRRRSRSIASRRR